MIRIEMDRYGQRVIIEGSSSQEIISIVTNPDFREMMDVLTESRKPLLASNNDLAADITGFMNKASAASISERILLCFLFSSKYEGQELLNKNDIENLFFRIRDPIPGNTNALLNSMESQGLLVRHKEKKNGLIAFYLSSKGMEYTERLVGEFHP